MKFPSRPNPLVVIILDGWGIRIAKEGNAIATAHTPTMDAYAKLYPTTAISAAGVEVGLPWGEVGNSETGHRNIGAGQVMYQVLPKIDRAIADGSFYTNPVFLHAIEHTQQFHSNLHLIGLLSDGGVHAQIRHLIALLDTCARQGMHDRVYIHVFTDGRDTPAQRAPVLLNKLEEAIGKFAVGKIASLTGRFYAMDRNENWDRTERTYNLLIGNTRGESSPSAASALARSYQRGVLDERMLPTTLTRGGEAVAHIADNDAVLFFNFRPDRARQLTQAFLQPEKVGFPANPIKNLFFGTMAKYDDTFASPCAFIEDAAICPIAKVISDAGLAQLHVAETEKYAHVTYYLNVGNEKAYPNEDRKLIASSSVSDFADEPHMQAESITDYVVDDIARNTHDVYFINFANADMIGHTGNFSAAVDACAFVDTCIARIQEAVFAKQGALLVTADHGNAEEMINPTTGAVETDHTTNPVVVHVIAEHLRRTTPKSDSEIAEILTTPIGVLSDIAPTILDILSIEKPPQMTGISLLPSLR
ncbi:MAG: phosphoglycerate mutase (2,3-diphosphoglycerate-independent) [Candidatus Andersenbacteria bacterium RIFCSPHIGHO2_12_FULL_45_11b]|uniref:2,3-bisphosphoglycerate-independent phosphoglycerate mutase n=1 Tax=Candidatus Andersenbacteria bacterium RIFCSPHIGHO2_12_FULL_45_11b TaxID=1797282 RepID=A0A1G1X7A7_9BACT|nr:MAG: phosphoglycerate mutase (2,3-diphosphoglycerate-independent) [Candidatus Andersenbacteria bacterium RIFCSPHIGHO2_12_FULL_45_11b]